MIYTRSAAINMVAVVAEVGREVVPNASAVLDVFLAVHNRVRMVRANKRDLETLGNGCSYLIAYAIEKCRQRADGINSTPLKYCFRDTAEVMSRCGGQRYVAKALKGVSDKGEIEAINLRMDRLFYEMGLFGTKAILVSAGCDRLSRNDAAHDVSLMHACHFNFAVGGCSVLIISSHEVFVGCAHSSRTLRRRQAFHGASLIICNNDSSLTPLYLQPMSSDGCKRLLYVPFISVGLHCHKYS